MTKPNGSAEVREARNQVIYWLWDKGLSYLEITSIMETAKQSCTYWNVRSVLRKAIKAGILRPHSAKEQLESRTKASSNSVERREYIAQRNRYAYRLMRIGGFQAKKAWDEVNQRYPLHGPNVPHHRYMVSGE